MPSDPSPERADIPGPFRIGIGTRLKLIALFCLGPVSLGMAALTARAAFQTTWLAGLFSLLMALMFGLTGLLLLWMGPSEWGRLSRLAEGGVLWWLPVISVRPVSKSIEVRYRLPDGKEAEQRVQGRPLVRDERVLVLVLAERGEHQPLLRSGAPLARLPSLP